MDEHQRLAAMLENSCDGVRRRLFHKVKWIIVFLKCLFFCLFAVDMTAGQSAVTHWLWAPLSFAVYPVILWMISTVSKYRETYMRKRPQESTNGAPPNSGYPPQGQPQGLVVDANVHVEDINTIDMDNGRGIGRMSTLMIRKSIYGRSSMIRSSIVAVPLHLDAFPPSYPSASEGPYDNTNTEDAEDTVINEYGSSPEDPDDGRNQRLESSGSIIIQTINPMIQ